MTSPSLRDSIPADMPVIPPAFGRMRTLTAPDLSTLPAPRYLVKNLLYKGTLAHLVGPSGSYKSFLALDLSAAVAGGLSWHGRRTKGGGVLYVCAEGAGSLRYRVQAWEQHHGRDMTGVTFVPHAVQIHTEEFEALRFEVAQLRPDLVVIDTQAQCTVGLEENSNTDMMRAMRRLTRLAQESGACVLLVHHTGHGAADRARGASAVYAAMDTVLMVRPQGEKGTADHALTLTSDKQKDGPTGAVGRPLAPLPVYLDGVADEDGDPISSVVLVELDGPAAEARTRTPEEWARALWDAGVKEPMGRAKLITAAKAAGVELPGRNDTMAAIVKAHKLLCECGGLDGIEVSELFPAGEDE